MLQIAQLSAMNELLGKNTSTEYLHA